MGDFVWQWPQITLAILLFIKLAISAAMNGEPRKDNFSFPVALVGIGLTLFLLYMGGFWTEARP